MIKSQASPDSHEMKHLLFVKVRQFYDLNN